MRVGFYAPLKPPDHPVPSGDRLVARLLIQALEMAGLEVAVMSRCRSRDGLGDPARQARLARLGHRQVDRILDRAAPPDLWFTYHLYHKAPDLIGPAVAARLGIPYVVAEASSAPKQAAGPWAAGHAAVAAALGRAAAVIGLNPADAPCVLPLLADPARYHALRPFLDLAPFDAAREQRLLTRASLAAQHCLDPDRPWLIAVAMMRPGDKLASYRLLGAALSRIQDRPWQLLVVGDGEARAEVEAALAPVARRVAWLGAMPPCRISATLAAADCLVWPALREAWGMALLEAEAAGLPVVAGRVGGVPSIVVEDETGLLAAEGDEVALAGAVARLLDDPDLRRVMGRNARAHAAAHHGLPTAARRLDAILRGLP
ncbi:MAG TPA: glycosyltransferase family 4 protein [Aliidongia sp.]|uniref:glycosyltransferase family 4 protein n=1 Tax=Aliidongia sp. TaxID=1914230 RepID=UPI002DDCFA1B|nr:glycosyltransferase family 4 protein [Aliidongia sp.]HEV2677717.1 glycosyltransferase family 4 protein [Aliidongia sp.]